MTFACGSEVFVSEEFPLDETYVNFLKIYEGAAPLPANFKSDLTRLGINRFVEENTNFQMREIFPFG